MNKHFGAHLKSGGSLESKNEHMGSKELVGLKGLTNAEKSSLGFIKNPGSHRAPWVSIKIQGSSFSQRII